MNSIYTLLVILYFIAIPLLVASGLKNIFGEERNKKKFDIFVTLIIIAFVTAIINSSLSVIEFWEVLAIFYSAVFCAVFIAWLSTVIFKLTIGKFIFMCLLFIPIGGSIGMFGAILLTDEIARIKKQQYQDTYLAQANNYKASKQEIITTQRQLAYLGYDVGTADGIIGKKTIAGIREFERREFGVTSGNINQRFIRVLSSNYEYRKNLADNNKTPEQQKKIVSNNIKPTATIPKKVAQKPKPKPKPKPLVISRAEADKALGTVCKTGLQGGNKIYSYSPRQLEYVLYLLRSSDEYQAEAIKRAQSCISNVIAQTKRTSWGNYPLSRKVSNDIRETYYEFEFSGQLPIEISYEVQLVAGLHVQMAFTNLAHWNANYHNATAAKRSLDDARQELRNASYTAQNAARNWIRSAKNHLYQEQLKEQRKADAALARARESRSDSMWGSMIGAVVGGALAKNAGLESQDAYRIAMQAYDQQTRRIQNNYSREVGDINTKLARAEAEVQYSQNALNVIRLGASDRTVHKSGSGVRLFIDRYSDFPTDDIPINPTSAVVKLTTANGLCTASAFREGNKTKFITAQHCVIDDNQRLKSNIQLQYQYISFSNDYPSDFKTYLKKPQATYPGTFDNNALILRGPWTITTAKGHFGKKPNWRWHNDWAILESSSPQARDFMFHALTLPTEKQAKTLEYLLSQDQRKVTLAGYAGDIMHGQYLTMDWGCDSTKVKDTSFAKQAIFRYDCAGFPGDSGAPITFADTSWGGYIAGIHSHGYNRSSQTRSKNSRGAVFIGHVLKSLRTGDYRTLTAY